MPQRQSDSSRKCHHYSDTLLVVAGDSRAAVLVDRYVNNIAVGIANVQQTLAPSHYILHGDVVLGGAPMIEVIATHVRHLVPNRPGLNIENIGRRPGR
jgi:predicted NBD/HSP70 family sugar kinase